MNINPGCQLESRLFNLQRSQCHIGLDLWTVTLRLGIADSNFAEDLQAALNMLRHCAISSERPRGGKLLLMEYALARCKAAGAVGEARKVRFMELHAKLDLGLPRSLVGFFIAWPAYAYIDPGTATIALQAVIGAIAVAGIFFRDKVQRFLALFRKPRDNKERETKAKRASPRWNLGDR